MDIHDRRAALEALHAPWTPMTLDERLARCAEVHDDQPLVICNGETLSYREVDARATRMADGLAALGVRSGDRVGVLMANLPALVPIKFAIARAGAIAVALDAGPDRAGLEDALRASGCRVLITMTGHAGADYLAMLDAIVPGWETRVGGALPDLEHVVVLSTDGRERDWAMTLDALEGIGTANRGATPPAGRTPDDPADLLRLPEPTTVSHDAVQRKAYASASARGFEVGRREVIAGPCLEPPGYVDGLLAVMLAGGAVIFC